METWAQPRKLVDNPGYRDDREQVLAALDLNAVDSPIRGVITAFSKLPYCHTLQCCYGHFVHAAQKDPYNIERLPLRDIGSVEYRIAYIALCIEDSPPGLHLRSLLEGITEIDTQYVQFGSPEWFWNQHLNSYSLQVEPELWMDRDVAVIEYQEALRVQEVRDLFFERLSEAVETSSLKFGVA
jgi:hypothetical protein